MSAVLKLKTGRQKPYDRDNLKRAYQATLSGMSVYRASRVYKVPESTLRDRTRANVSVDCSLGAGRLFSQNEEKKFVEHIVYMSTIGYGYCISDLQIIAADYAHSLGKTVKSKPGLSQGWVYSFVNRWDELKVVKPQKLSLKRAKCTSEETLKTYFNELQGVLIENCLMDSPERIYNIDESGFSTEHTPPKILCAANVKPQSVVSERSKTVTVIGSANAIGNHIPPFYIFPGKRWFGNLLDGAAPGSDGDMSESGFVNRGLFEKYMTCHFAKHSGLSKGSELKTLVLYDGHKSHMSLTLANWAKEHGVLLFVLPPHSSHLTQPLDVGIFGPMKTYYYKECRTYMHLNPGVNISRYEVAKLTAKPYAKAFSPDNICSAFAKAGIFPFCADVVVQSGTAPATIYQTTTETSETVYAATVENEDKSNQNELDLADKFLATKKITCVVQQRPKRKFTPPVKVQGNLLSDKNMETLQDLQEKKDAKLEKEMSQKPKKQKTILPIPVKKTSHNKSPKPSTSGTSKSGGPLILDPESSSDEYESDDEDLCCVCEAKFPPHLKGYPGLIILKWGQCDNCGHWVQLTHCTAVRVLRRGSTFFCVHCPEE